MSTAENVADQVAPATANEPSNGTAAPEQKQAEQAPSTEAAAAAEADAADEGCRLYIGNLPFATTEGELKEFFSAYTV